MFGWMKRLVDRHAPTATLAIGLGVLPPAWRKGKSVFADKIADAVSSSGAEPGDIVEVDEHGRARVVGRRPCVVDEKVDISEHAIHTRLRQIYGDDAPDTADLMRRCNVVFFRNNVIVFRKSDGT